MTRGALVALALHRRRHPKLVSLTYTAIVRKTHLPIASRFAFVRWAEEQLEARHLANVDRIIAQMNGVEPFTRAEDFGVMLG